MPSRNTYHLTWVSFTLDVGYLFIAVPAKRSRCSLSWKRRYLLTAAPPDLEHGVVPLCTPARAAELPLLGGGVAPLSRCPWPPTWGSSSAPLLRCRSLALSVTTPDQPGALGHDPWPWARGSSSWPRFCAVRHSQRAGFRKGRGTRDQTANVRWIIDKAREFQKNIDFCFVDYAKAFDCVDHNKLENSERDGNTRPPDLPLEKPVCRSGSNS